MYDDDSLSEMPVISEHPYDCECEPGLQEYDWTRERVAKAARIKPPNIGDIERALAVLAILDLDEVPALRLM